MELQQHDHAEHAPGLDPVGVLARLPVEPGLDDRVAVQARDRQQVEHGRGHLQEAQEGQRRPEPQVLDVLGVLVIAHDQQQHDREHRVRGRPDRGGEALRALAAEGVRVQVDRPARQADAALDDEEQRQDDRQQRVGVLERVERQVARRLDLVIAGPVGGVGVGELVQAQRHDPAGDDEQEHADVAEPRALPGLRPRQRRAAGAHRDEGEEQRARPHRPAAPPLVEVVHRHGDDGTGRGVSATAATRPRLG